MDSADEKKKVHRVVPEEQIKWKLNKFLVKYIYWLWDIKSIKHPGTIVNGHIHDLFLLTYLIVSWELMIDIITKYFHPHIIEDDKKNGINSSRAAELYWHFSFFVYFYFWVNYRSLKLTTVGPYHTLLCLNFIQCWFDAHFIPFNNSTLIFY